MALEPGTILGPYEVAEQLGRGGMGEVYRARDTRLERDVAVKLLPPEVREDATFLRRFRREARTISQLQHPNVCILHDVRSVGGVDFLVMEYLDGETLEARLLRGPLPIEEVPGLGAAIAAAVEAAHCKGVVHRDLKPGNIMLTQTGPKVFDFGLAREFTLGGGGIDSEAGTLEAITIEGSLVGTMPYMAPEQLQGRRVDARTDVWALGCVVYEMATGEQPFRGRSRADLIGSILGSQPEPLTRKQPLAPQRLDWVVRRCLRKDPEDRWQSARDVALELAEIHPPASSSHAASVSRDPRTPADRGEVDPSRVRSLAVLPLSNLSGDSEQEYFSDGMTEALLTELAKIGALKVISRTSVMQYKGTRKTVPTIASELGVDALVEGTVFRAGDEVRISTQLVHASDAQLWAESYERDLSNVLALQKEVARDIVQQIQVALTPREQRQLSARTSVQPEVYEAILKGRFHHLKFSPEGLERAKFWLQRAMELDPESALAHAWLAQVFGATGGWADVPPLEVWPEAERLARRAVELDDKLAEGHIAYGAVLAFLHYDWDAGEREFRQALELNPNSADSYYHHGLLRAGRGHLREAAKLLDRAMELDPLAPGIIADSALPLIFLERFDEAIERAGTAVEIAPDLWRANWVLSTAFAMQGELASAIELARRAVEQAGGNVRSEANLIAVLGLAGEEGEARERLRALLDSADRRWLPPYAIATAYAGLGDLTEAVDWLERGYEEHDLWMAFLGVDIALRRTIGADPRYARLLSRLGLDPNPTER